MVKIFLLFSFGKYVKRRLWNNIKPPFLCNNRFWYNKNALNARRHREGYRYFKSALGLFIKKICYLIWGKLCLQHDYTIHAKRINKLIIRFNIIKARIVLYICRLFVMESCHGNNRLPRSSAYIFYLKSLHQNKK